MITSADVQMLMTQCTYPKCAVPASGCGLHVGCARLLHSAPGIVNGTVPSTVSLDWPTVSVRRTTWSIASTVALTIRRASHLWTLAPQCSTNEAVAVLPSASPPRQAHRPCSHTFWLPGRRSVHYPASR